MWSVCVGEWGGERYTFTESNNKCVEGRGEMKELCAVGISDLVREAGEG